MSSSTLVIASVGVGVGEASRREASRREAIARLLGLLHFTSLRSQ
ncbi:hypothetical protein N0Y54_09830 [Nostoc punctiforme UO1]